ncbi:MAG: alpha amylase C-terminal domain-containing protein [Bacillota bacterium]
MFNYNRNAFFSFVRKGKKDDELFVIVCSFSDIVYKAGVQLSASYIEVMNSDAEFFGGSGVMNSKELNGREYHGKIYQSEMKTYHLV